MLLLNIATSAAVFPPLETASTDMPVTVKDDESKTAAAPSSVKEPIDTASVRSNVNVLIAVSLATSDIM